LEGRSNVRLQLLRKPVDEKKFRHILDRNRVKRIAVFGSYATGKINKSSDIDFLVDFEKGADLLDQVGLKLDLQDLLERKVDVVTPDSLSRYLRDRILDQAIYL
jgi:predicted nucleotidyltransferase